MADFKPNRPVETQEPVVEVDASPNRPLTPGKHRFQLVVTDSAGNQSAADEIEVVVLDDKRPTAVLDGPKTVRFGASFQLSGKRSSDPEGDITRYQWTLVASP